MTWHLAIGIFTWWLSGVSFAMAAMSDRYRRPASLLPLVMFPLLGVYFIARFLGWSM